MLKKLVILTVVLCMAVVGFAGCKSEESGKDATKAPGTTQSAASPSAANTPTKAATPTPSPTPTPQTEAVEEYSIEMDFQIEQRVLGIVFGFIDSENYLMWQVNIFDYEGQQQVTFKPHVWVDGQYRIIEQFEISNAIKWEDRNKKHHIKIDVSSDNEITTYINDVKVHTYKDDYAKYGLFGFRACKNESFYVDNVVIKNTATNETLLNLDFNDKKNPFEEGEIAENVMGSPAIYFTELSYSGPDMCVLE